MIDTRRVLVIDDEPTVRESCKRILPARGYDVETASSGKEGMDRVLSGYFDCVLIDLRMPDMDGMEIVRTVRRSRHGMAVVIITGYGTVPTASEAVRLGVTDYVCKPFTPDDIVDVVDRALLNTPGTHPAQAVGRLLAEVRESVPKPEHYEDRSPRALAQMLTRSVSVRKAAASLVDTIVLGVLAGVYIAFGAALATLVGHDAAARVGVGIAQVLVGTVFSVGLILVVVAGAELFTGNNLMVTGLLGKELGPGRLVGHWVVVYAANFLGAVLLALIMVQSGLWKMASGAVGVKALAIAHAKVNLPFGEAFFRGVGCNWLVCLAVWMALSAKRVAGKVLVILFPIMAFVALGYEHCVANMYFVPMGLFLKNTVAADGFDAAALSSLTWGKFLVANLIPVTLGNIVGGAIFVGTTYWWVYVRGHGQRA